MDRSEFQGLYKVGDVIQSGGHASRKNASKLAIVSIDEKGVRFQPINAKSKFRVDFDYIDLLMANFAEINPRSIQKSVNQIRRRGGLKIDTTTENYAYGFAKAIRHERATFSFQNDLDTHLAVGSGGFLLSTSARKAIEERGMALAEAHFAREGYVVERRGKPYDLRCGRGNVSLWVEVKATQGEAEEIILTRNEVELSKARSAQMALAIITNIHLKNGNEAAGGEIRVIQPWRVKEELLRPIAYFYSLANH
ncbi:DUF3883 domain-containing protein [Granulicella arctica]|uniref:DUF3883 domain-containing protein n=1 Tax=Granulicella arctica TaxID=940613 RepID=UPI0021DF8B40|nr:DUF3883 domain-containing protein [Granulicella arctica]